MKPVLLFSIIALCIFSCTSKKAVEFRDTISKKEHEAFNIVAGKDGPETEKLECLIKKDYNCALNAINKVDSSFSTLLKDIQELNSQPVKQGAELKRVATDYYTRLQYLFVSDRKEVELRMALDTAKGEKLNEVQKALLEFTRNKQGLYDSVLQKSETLHQAINDFSKANGI